jgi:hypothetical protein
MRGSSAAARVWGIRCRRSSIGTISTPAMPAAARPAAVVIRISRAAIHCVSRFIASGRLENDIKVVRRPKPCAKFRRIELMRAEVVQDQGMTIQQRLDVDELPRPAKFLENALTELEVPGLLLRIEMSAVDLIGGSQSQYFGSSTLRHRMGTVAVVESLRIVRREPNLRSGCLDRREDFPELDAPVGLDHDELAPLKRRVAIKRTGEPPHVSHHAVTD